MERQKISIGIIGCGWITEYAHIPTILQNGEATLLSVYDVDSNRASFISKKFNITKWFDDLEEFLLSGINSVIIATPNYTHGDYTLSAIEHGLHVLCEKPVAISTEEMLKIKNAIKEQDIVYVPGYVNRWRMDVQELRKLIDEKAIGTILSMRAGWLRKCGIPRPGTWFTDKRYSGGGVLQDLGSHILDICLMLLGDRKLIDSTMIMSVENKEVSKESGAKWFLSDIDRNCSIDVENTAVITGEFTGNVQLEVMVSWLAPIAGDCTYFEIIGDKGKIKLNTLFGFSNDRLWLEDSLTLEQNGDITQIPLKKEENNGFYAFSGLHHYFVKAIEEHDNEYASYQDGEKVVSFIEALYQNGFCDDSKVNKVLRDSLNDKGMDRN